MEPKFWEPVAGLELMAIDTDIIGGIAIGAILALGSALIGFLIGNGSAEDKTDLLKQEAIKRGYAHWVVDEKGYSTFEWN